MKPILYSPTETQFLTNGIGCLSDSVSCFVKEELNGLYELEMEYPIDGIHYDDIQLTCQIYAVPSEGKRPQAFRIYKISAPMNGIVKIYARHISYQLSYINLVPFEATSAPDAMIKLKANAVEDCPFEFWTDLSTVAHYTQTAPASLRSRLGGVRGSILDIYGGQYEWDMYTVKLWKRRGEDNNVVLRYGRNIIDLEQERNIENTYTGVIPFWSDTEGNTLMIPEIVVSSDAAANFPYPRNKVLDLSETYEEQPTVEQLRSKARTYVRQTGFGVPKVSIKVSFVALAKTDQYKSVASMERIHLGDTVTVEYEKLGVQAQAQVVSIRYNVLLERDDEIEIGDVRSTMSQTLVDMNAETEAKIQQTASHMQRAIDYVTQVITGSKGGYARWIFNADGEPQELLFMNQPDVQAATQILRINKDGIGFSAGYNAQIRTGWTVDGHFVADFIDTGILTANIIKAGVLQGLTGDTWFNLQTGVLHLATDAEVGDNGITLAQINVNKTSIESEVTRATQAEGNLSTRITQNANAITTKVSAGDIASTINQTAQSVLIDASKINLSGYVTIAGLTGGTTTIDGACIKTGTINAARLDLTGVATIAGLQNGTTTINGGCITTGTISGDRINGGTITGTTISGGAILGALFRSGDAQQHNLMMEINGPYGYVYCHNFHLIDTEGNTKGGFEIDTNTQYGNSSQCRIQSGHGIHMLASEGDEWSWFEQKVRFDIYPDFGSDRRIKEDIVPLDHDAAIAFLLALNPVSYAMVSDKQHRIHHGLIAQEVQEVLGDGTAWDLVSDPGAGMLGLSYMELIADLISAVQTLHKRLEEVEAWKQTAA